MAKPPVVSVPAAVVSSAGVTTLPVTVAGISVAIGQPQKAAGMSTDLLKRNKILNPSVLKVGCFKECLLWDTHFFKNRSDRRCIPVCF